MRVQISIILARAEQTILLCNKKEGSGLWRLGWDDSSGLQMFINEGLASFLFLQVKRVHFSDLWNERGFEINGVVIWSMRRQNVMGFLREHILEVGTPIRDLLIRDFSSLGQFGGQGDLVEMFAIEILLKEVLMERHIILRRISLGEK